MSREYYNELRMAMFGDESLSAWGREVLLRNREEFIEDGLKEIRMDLELVFGKELDRYLAELEAEAEAD